MADVPSTPVTVEQDGWTLSSGSSDQPTEADLRAALSNEAPSDTPPAPAERRPGTPPAKEPEAPREEPESAEPAEPETPPEQVATAAQRRRTHDPQRRIDRMNAQLAEEREQRIRLQAELDVIRRQQAAPPPQAPPQAPPAAAPPAPVPPSAPAITSKPAWGGPDGYEANGKSWEEYEDDKAAWNRQELFAEANRLVEERLKLERNRGEEEQRKAHEVATRRQADSAFLERVNAVRAKRPDYDAVVEKLGDLDSPAMKHLIYTSSEGPNIGLYLAEHLDDAQVLVGLPWSGPIVDTIRRSNVPVKLLAHFAEHPEEVEQLARQDFVSAISAIGRLEARLDVGHTVTTGAAPPVTRARPPLRTVGGGAPTTRTPNSSASYDMEFSPEYISAANREEHRKQAQRRGY